MFIEIILRSRLKAIDAVAQKDLVAVHGKDLLFGEVALNLDGQHHLLDLAAEVALRREEQIARELHGQRGSALRPRTRGDIAISGAQYPPEIDSPVLLKILVFGGENCVAQDFRELIIGSQHAALKGKRADHLSMVVIKLRDGARTVVFEFADLRQVS